MVHWGYFYDWELYNSILLGGFPNGSVSKLKSAPKVTRGCSFRTYSESSTYRSRAHVPVLMTDLRVDSAEYHCHHCLNALKLWKCRLTPCFEGVRYHGIQSHARDLHARERRFRDSCFVGGIIILSSWKWELLRWVWSSLWIPSIKVDIFILSGWPMDPTPRSIDWKDANWSCECWLMESCHAVWVHGGVMLYLSFIAFCLFPRSVFASDHLSSAFLVHHSNKEWE